MSIVSEAETRYNWILSARSYKFKVTCTITGGGTVFPMKITKEDHCLLTVDQKYKAGQKALLWKKNASFVEFYCYVISILDSTLKNEFHGILLIDDGICLRRSSQFSTRWQQGKRESSKNSQSQLRDEKVKISRNYFVHVAITPLSEVAFKSGESYRSQPKYPDLRVHPA